MNATTPTPAPAVTARGDGAAVPGRCPNCQSAKSVRTLDGGRCRCGCGHRWTLRKGCQA